MRKPLTKRERTYLRVIAMLNSTSNLSCQNPVEFDIGEYAACMKCWHCKVRFTIEKMQKRGELPKRLSQYA